MRRPMTSTDHPIGPDELDGLFGRLGLSAGRPCALAVSGGADSMALMVLFAEWLAQRRLDACPHTVLTVDHALRPQSGAEAHAVGHRARALGLRHAILAWEGAKPATGIQAAARQARYRLMRAHMRAHRIGLLLTAHTRDDQAETVLMRLARGSGLDGLAGMAPVSSMDMWLTDDAVAADAQVLARPLLDVPKARLIATLRARDVPWIEDPSNHAPAHERPRLRARRAERDALGLTDAMLAVSARRLLRARRTLDDMAERLCESAGGAVAVDPCGSFTLDRARLREAGEDIALRVLGRVIAAAGGSGAPVPLARLETMAEELCAADAKAAGRWTLARAMITATQAAVIIEREPPRGALPELTLTPGAKVLWDGRFRVEVGPNPAGGSVQVRPLGEAALTRLRTLGMGATAAPTRVAAMVPAFWREDRLVAVPPLAYWAAPEDRERLAAEFIGIGNSKRRGPARSVLKRHARCASRRARG